MAFSLSFFLSFFLFFVDILHISMMNFVEEIGPRVMGHFFLLWREKESIDDGFASIQRMRFVNVQPMVGFDRCETRDDLRGLNLVPPGRRLGPLHLKWRCHRTDRPGNSSHFFFFPAPPLDFVAFDSGNIIRMTRERKNGEEKSIPVCN